MKKINLGVCFGIIITCICLFFETGYTATYYVSSSGKDNKPGSKEQTAWQTIAKVNSFVFSDGDTVLFKRGDTFSDSTLEIKNVENFTIGDYGQGDKPLFDGNKIKPILIRDSKNVTIKNINISGQEWQTDKSSNIEVENVEGLVIDGVYGNGHTINNGISYGKTAISIQNGSGLIEIKNCELFNWGPYDLPKPGTDDFMGIALMNMKIGEYKIHGNKIYNINSDGIHLSLTKANGAVFNNILYNAGADAIGIKGSENCEVYDNEFYRTAEFLGEGGSGSGGLPAYINLDQHRDLFSKNNTISANSFKGGDSVAIKLGNAEDTKINENIFSNVKSALYIQDLVKNTMFHHNIIENPQSRIITSQNIDAGCIYENNSGTGTQIHNNTIYNGKGNCKHLVTLANNNKTIISNNIVHQNYSSEDAFGLYHNPTVTEPVVINNYWYNPNKINRVKHSNKIYTADMQEEWNETHPGDKFGNPLMNDPEEGDYSLYETSLKLGAVYDETDDTVPPTDDTTVVIDDSVTPTDDTTVVTDDTETPTDDTTVITDDTEVLSDDSVTPTDDTTVVTDDTVVITEESVAATDDSTVVKRSYYVTQDGAGLKDGTSLANAWSISNFNSTANWSATEDPAKINFGDTVYLHGEFTDPFVIRRGGVLGDHVIIDGSNASIQVSVITKGKIFDVMNASYLTFRNLNIDGQDATMEATTGRAGIYVREFGQPTGYITIEDCNIIQSSSGVTLQGNVPHVNIFRNTFEKMSYYGVALAADHWDSDDLWYYEDCPTYITIGGSANNGNVFKNIGKRIGSESVPGQTLGTWGTDIIFSYNHVYADMTDVGTGIYMNGAKRVLVEYNEIHGLEADNHRSPINFKCDPNTSSDGQLLFSEDIIIRFNKVYDVYSGPNTYAPPETAIRISGRGRNRIIHGNFLDGGGINLNWNWQEENEGIGGEGYYVWANIIRNTKTSGGIVFVGTSLNTDIYKDCYIFNNTIYNIIQEHESTASYNSGIGAVDNSLNVVSNMNIKNNIVVNTRPNSDESVNYRVPYAPGNSFDHNHHYHFMDKIPKVILIGSNDTTYDWNSSNLPDGYGTNDTFGDPRFRNADNGDFALMNGSPCIGSGINLAGISIPEILIQGTPYQLNFSQAIDPKTDWSATPANIVTSDRANNVNWDQGAYIFKNEDL